MPPIAGRGDFWQPSKAGCAASRLSPLLTFLDTAFQRNDCNAKAPVTCDAILGHRLVVQLSEAYKKRNPEEMNSEIVECARQYLVPDRVSKISELMDALPLPPVRNAKKSVR